MVFMILYMNILYIYIFVFFFLSDTVQSHYVVCAYVYSISYNH